jgi:hypothetical protein
MFEDDLGLVAASSLCRAVSGSDPSRLVDEDIAFFDAILIVSIRSSVRTTKTLSTSFPSSNLASTSTSAICDSKTPGLEPVVSVF